MSTRSTERGFTLVELVLMIVLIGALAAVALPRMDALLTLGRDGWRQDVIAALREAHSTALARRRLVCASVSTGSVSLSLAPANPATSCTVVLPMANGQNTLTLANAPASSSTTLYFQPDGRATSDGAGTSATDIAITLSGYPSLLIASESGYAR